MGVFQIDGNERTWKTAGNFHEDKNSWGYLEDEGASDLGSPKANVFL